MALQGTLETFSLPDVLQLLSSTKKSGCLRVSGDRGDGSLWVKDGAVVASKASGAPQATAAVDVVFELLRFAEGEFVFEDGDEATDAGAPAEVQALLDEAGGMLEEWQAIEAVVPSGDHWVSLKATAPGDEVILSADTWRAVVAVGDGRAVQALGAGLELAELPVARLVKSLVEQGLVEVGEPREAGGGAGARARGRRRARGRGRARRVRALRSGRPRDRSRPRARRHAVGRRRRARGRRGRRAGGGARSRRRRAGRRGADGARAGRGG